jgi:leader peptidase (prepilin peptidase) / N-methyltransferase
VLGAVGWAALAVAAVLAALFTLAVAAVRRGSGRLPHGPALLTATWLCAIFPGAP